MDNKINQEKVVSQIIQAITTNKERFGMLDYGNVTFYFQGSRLIRMSVDNSILLQNTNVKKITNEEE